MVTFSRWKLACAIAGALIFNAPAFGADAESSRAAAIVKGIQSSSAKETEESLRDLDKWARVPKPSMSEEDKLALFDALSKSSTPLYADNGTRLLVRFPKSDPIIASAKKTIAERNPSGSALVAALKYLENTDDKAFESYFTGKKIDKMPAVVLDYFLNGLTVNYLTWEEKDVDVLAEKYIKWKPSRRDQGNPFKPAILKFRDKAVKPLVKAQPDPSQLEIGTVWLFGEIGSPEALPYLLKEYQRNPNSRTSISVGACLDKANIDSLFAEIKSDDQLRKIILDMVGPEQAELAKSNRDELKEYVASHLIEIRNGCQKRSMPIVG